MLKRLCRDNDCAVLLLAHPSLSGMSTGRGTSGNTAWNNSARSRLYFEAVKHKDDERNEEQESETLRTLTVKKSNYGPTGKKVTSNGAMGHMKSWRSLTAPCREGRPRRCSCNCSTRS